MTIKNHTHYGFTINHINDTLFILNNPLICKFDVNPDGIIGYIDGIDTEFVIHEFSNAQSEVQEEFELLCRKFLLSDSELSPGAQILKKQLNRVVRVV